MAELLKPRPFEDLKKYPATQRRKKLKTIEKINANKLVEKLLAE
jgi:hypothetical protein